ncbi:MAG TPA: orotidine-5'-phosphate decarboxylase [Thermoanaerobaculia bacterium]|nr:orotidine-5'-phosphate decarboxylase [Thermoanaerobaculia bacterium]
MNASDRLIVALDRSSRSEILRLVDELSGLAGVFKVGLQAFTANGPDLVREIAARGERVFLDLKLHDIPNTVRKAVEEASRLGAEMLTVHASGGEAMMRAAAEAAAGSGRPLLVLGVTVLTSLDARSIAQIGLEGSAEQAARRLASLAKGAGLGGVVASPREIAAIRREIGAGITIVTPGIRAARETAGDQSRTLPADEALRLGADYLVVGRPITESPRPREAAEAFVREMSGSH